jgi:tetratricopeptide (TPR) repeat protein
MTDLESVEPQTAQRLVGRTWPRGVLAAAVNAATAGRGGLVLVTGEPGMGKSRLLAELDPLVAAVGGHVLRGTCWETAAAPAFWQWIQAVRGWVGGRSPLDLLNRHGAVIEDALRLVPEFAAELPPQKLLQLTGPGARLPLYQSVTALLSVAASEQPLVVVLDDLHWADLAALQLLRFLTNEVLIVGAYRPHELEGESAAVLTEVAKRAQVLELTGLDVEDTGKVLAAASGLVSATSVVESIHQRTAGNPLFVRELGHLLAARGEQAVAALVPDSVHTVLRRRLARLSQPCQLLLETAAVVGSEFRLDVVRVASRLPTADVPTLIDEALRSRLVAARGPAAYQFSHALVRDALYDGLPSAHRAELHLRIAVALENSAASDSELAHHYLHAVGPGADATVTGKAIRYAAAAGRAALAALAFEEAVLSFDQALELQDRRSPEAAQLLLDRGDALLRCGRISAAREDFTEVAAAARHDGHTEDLARAALGFAAGFSGFEVRLLDRAQIDLLEEADAALGPDDSELRAWTLARLSVALSFVAPAPRRRLLAEQAVAMARRLDDRIALAHALAAHCDAIAGPAEVRIRLDEATEIIELAWLAADRGLELLGRRFRVVGLLELGDSLGADAEITTFGQVAAELRQPLYSWYVPLWRGMRAHRSGDLAECERCAAEAARVGALADSRNAQALSFIQRNWVVLERGSPVASAESITALAAELPELAPSGVESMLDLFPLQPSTPRRTAAMDGIEGVLAGLPMDSEWLSNLCFAAWSVIDQRHRGAAAVLLDALRPYADLFAVDGIAVATHGCVARPLGALCHVLGRYEEATQFFEQALVANRRALAPLLVAHTQRQYGAMLRDRAAPGDAERADSLLREAAAAYRSMGLDQQVERALVDDPGGRDVFRREGDYWTIGYAGSVVRLKDVKGLRDLARLFARPGAEVHVLDLVGVERPAPEGDTGEVLDQQARSAYRRRLEELDAELVVTPSEDRRTEREFLVAELASAYGLGGRVRHGGDRAERARSTVTWRIRDALRRIEQAHPALGRHLRASVRTGIYCCYDPESPHSWQL